MERSFFSIQGISSNCAVAVELDGTLYAYRTYDYIPETLGNLIDDLNLRQNISFGSVWYNYRKESGEYAMVEFVGLKMVKLLNFLHYLSEELKKLIDFVIQQQPLIK